MDSKTNQPPYRLSLPVLPNNAAQAQQSPADQPEQSPPPAQAESRTAAPAIPGGAQAAHGNRERPAGMSPELQALEDKIIERLRDVYDPEIPINVYDLGLIYDVQISPDGNVRILMTLTAPGCPVAGSLPLEVEASVEHVPEVKRAVVDLVWDPPWTREMLSEEAKLELGL